MQALKLSPGSLKCFYRLGLELTASKSYEEAWQYLAAAHRLAPKNGQVKKALDALKAKQQPASAQVHRSTFCSELSKEI